MSCIYFVPQIQTITGGWIDIDKPQLTAKEAEQSRVSRLQSGKPVVFRVLQISCDDKVRVKTPCCGR